MCISGLTVSSKSLFPIDSLKTAAVLKMISTLFVNDSTTFALKFVSLPLLSYTLYFAVYDPVAPPPFSITTKRWLIIPSTVI